ncbi:MAG: flagellar basal body protein FliL [Gammaproteobacteria bacterium]|nr:MAG: flagellar basal body protein FliL [Gammaproteobacteria bacterium]
MAIDRAVDIDEEAAPASPGKKPRRLWLWSMVLLMIGGSGAGAAWYLDLIGPVGVDGIAAEERVRPPIYFTLDDNLVVNFQSPGRARYLQVGIELMTRDEAAIPVLKRHAAVVRNNLIMLLSDQSFEGLSSREGKETLQQAALEEVQRVLVEFHGSPAVESLYFTGFLMQ